MTLDGHHEDGHDERYAVCGGVAAYLVREVHCGHLSLVTRQLYQSLLPVLAAAHPLPATRYFGHPLLGTRVRSRLVSAVHCDW